MLPPLLLALHAQAAVAAPEGCVAPAPRADVLRALDALEAAYGELHLDEVAAQQARLLTALSCLGVILTPAEVARLHRGQALAALAAGQTDEARLRFAASRKLEPSYRFPPELVPDDPAYREWEIFRSVPLSVSMLGSTPAPTEGRLLLDGEPARPAGELDGVDQVAREVGLPLFVQVLDDADAPVVSAYLEANTRLPRYPGRDQVGAAARVAPQVVVERRWRPGDWVLFGTSTAALLGGTAVLVSTYQADRDYCRDEDGALTTEKGCTVDYYNTYIATGKIGGWSLIGVGLVGISGTALRVGLRDGGAALSVSGSW
jgi:hypothetical protein